MLCDNLKTALVLLEFGADPDLESWETMRYRFLEPTDSNVHIGRTWMASHPGSYVKEICLYLNLLEGKLRISALLRHTKTVIVLGNRLSYEPRISLRALTFKFVFAMSIFSAKLCGFEFR